MLEPKEEIKSRLDIVDVINEYVALKPAGVNHKALCPFHTEKTPSFMVSRDRQTWRCFGCGEGGDLYSFIMKMEGLDFPEALKLLAHKAGVTLRRADPQLTSRRNTLLAVAAAAAEYWRELLAESPRAAAVRAYVRERSIAEQTAATFQLGWAPDSWEETGRHLKRRGFTDADIFESGLSVKQERGSGFYDRFRNRLMFPIHDAHGQVVGCGGRTLDPQEKGAKYINTPATLIYNKSVVLYNLHRAKSDIRANDQAVLVEGYLDALASYEAGVKNVVAVSGTALTPEQVKRIKYLTGNLAIAFDMDPAGAAAAWRGIDVALAAECNVKVITLPFGKDPDECIRRDSTAWREAVGSAAEFMEYCFRKTIERFPPTTAGHKKQAAQLLIAAIAKLGSAVEQAHWLRQLSSTLDVPEAVLREALPRPAHRGAPPGPSVTPPETKPRWLRLEEQLISLLLYRHGLVATALQWLGPEQLADPNLAALYRALVVYYNEGQAKAGSTTFFEWLSTADVEPPPSRALADQLYLIAADGFSEFEPSAVSREVVAMCTELKREYLRRQLREVQHALRLAESAGNRVDVDRWSRQFTELTGQLNLLGT